MQRMFHVKHPLLFNAITVVSRFSCEFNGKRSHGTSTTVLLGGIRMFVFSQFYTCGLYFPFI